MRTDLYEDMYKTEDSHWWHWAKRRFVKMLINSIALKPSPSLLDVGCGTGKMMETLSLYGKVSGVDISTEALLFCKKRNLVDVKKGEAEHLPYVGETFDIVSVLDVLEHVDDTVSIREIKRVLKKKGFVIITVPAFSWLWSKWDVALHHKRRYTKSHLKEILEKEGFSIIRNTYIHSFLVLPSLIIRKLKQLSRKPYSSDFQLNNALLNRAFMFLSKLEQMWINRYDMPFGTSVLCIAQKNP